MLYLVIWELVCIVFFLKSFKTDRTITVPLGFDVTKQMIGDYPLQPTGKFDLFVHAGDLAYAGTSGGFYAFFLPFSMLNPSRTKTTIGSLKSSGIFGLNKSNH